VNLTIVDQKTALENHTLGSYEELGNEMLFGSVRSVDEEGKLKPVSEVPKGKRLALKAMQRQEINGNDILEFQSTLCIGERNDGRLKYFKMNVLLKILTTRSLWWQLLKKKTKIG
jgi:hypothetical protein